MRPLHDAGCVCLPAIAATRMADALVRHERRVYMKTSLQPRSPETPTRLRTAVLDRREVQTEVPPRETENGAAKAIVRRHVAGRNQVWMQQSPAGAGELRTSS